MDAGAQLVGMAVIPAQQEPDAPGSKILLATSQAIVSETRLCSAQPTDAHYTVTVAAVHADRPSCVQGYGKRVATDEFMLQRRGGKGNIAIKLRDGDTLVDFHPVSGDPAGARDLVTSYRVWCDECHLLVTPGRSWLLSCARVRQACCHDAGGDDAEEVLFVSAGGLVSRILVSAITTQSRTAKGIAMLNLQVSSKIVPVFTKCFDHVDVNKSLSTGIYCRNHVLAAKFVCVAQDGDEVQTVTPLRTSGML